jgi:phosphatidate cytidylyltransferase
MTHAPAKKSDLGTRAISAVVMLAVAGVCFFLGGLWLKGLILVMACAALAEFILLIAKITNDVIKQLFATLGGAIYISIAAANLMLADEGKVITLVGAVICVDIFAYFFGRTIGGPKIAPRISPSKTWAGLLGGIAGATIALVGMHFAFGEFYGTSLCSRYYDTIDIISGYARDLPTYDERCHFGVFDFDWVLFWQSVAVGAVIAVVAQAGDFFESWLKRRAGVKDSSRLIPGHGGVFDRVDGLLAVAFVEGMITFSLSGFHF